MDLIIKKSKKLKPSENYFYLRDQGLQHIQKMSHGIWTDYNTHDPGITTLEMLCYTLTDLAYRTNFPIEDILAEVTSGDEEDIRNFVSARQILPGNPVTINDFRKLLIDVPGVRNAWVDFPPVIEPQLYVDCKQSKLLTSPSNRTKPVELHGLYNIVLELDTFPELNDQDLNIHTFSINIGQAENSIAANVVLPGWDSFFNNNALPQNLKIGPPASIEKSQKYQAELIVDKGGANEKRFPVVIVLQGEKTAENLQLLGAELNRSDGILAAYAAGVEKALQIANVACQKLHEHRNLCEDCYEFRSLDAEEIILCSDIEVSPEADIEQVLAEVYHRVAAHVAPAVRFYSWDEMVQKGRGTEDIFSGPALDHGFIDDDELQKSSLKTQIRVSDLVQIIMDIPGVSAVRKIQLSNSCKGEILNPGEESVLFIGRIYRVTDSILQVLRAEGLSQQIIDELKTLRNRTFYNQNDFIISLEQTLSETLYAEDQLLILKHTVKFENRAARFNIERSRVIFYKGFIRYQAQSEEVRRRLNDLRGLERGQKLASADHDLEIPQGVNRNIQRYSSIQYDYPLVYGIGQEGLAESATDLRKAQARQLRAYLLFYDKMLADYLSQLAHIKDLFTSNSSVKRTYFSQPLYELPENVGGDVPNVSSLIKKFIDDFASQGEDWEDFIAAESVDYLGNFNAIDPVVEDEKTYEDRKNRFLDHLMARFCEQFTDYVMLMYTLGRKRAPQELIEDKLAFLDSYPIISRDRGKAFNYLSQEAVWPSENVSGLQQRVARLLGISSFKRRSLTDFEIYLEQDNDGLDEFRFRLVDGDGKILLSSSKHYETIVDCEAEILAVEVFGTDTSNYKKETQVDGQIYFNLCNDQDEVIARRLDAFASEAECEAEIENVVAFFNARPDAEGFHLIEHILLRPRTTTDNLMAVCTNENCDTCSGFIDPYSSRVTVVVPAWPARFANMQFRQFFESTIRMEAPAHVHVKICWVDQPSMRQFEMTYRDWLTAIAEKDFDQTVLSIKQNKLLSSLASLRSIYRKVTLHDCREDDDNPIVLNQGFLGTEDTE